MTKTPPIKQSAGFDLYFVYQPLTIFVNASAYFA